MDYKDYYKILGVDRGADEAAIKQAYRKLARQYHPDRNKDPGAAARMSEINEANTVLSDPEKRAAYDALGPDGVNGAGGFQPPPGWQGGRSRGFGGAAAPGQAGMSGEEFSEFFSSLFGQAAGGRGGFHFEGFEPGQGFGAAAGAGQARLRRGADAEARIEIDLAEAYHGGTRTFTVSGGPGGARTLEVRIPKGVRAGQKIRLAGYGHPGQGGAPAGDLLLEVGFKADARYRVDGADVTQQLPVTPWEAALGAEIGVHTLGGELSVGVPAGSASGRKLRLKGRGLPGKVPGDYFLELQVVLPPADTPRARELYESMARELDFNPRA